MASHRPSFSSAPRPSSAIFIGGLPQPLPSSPSPVHSSPSTHSQLPSPPATNSGSTGDSNSTSTGSIRRTSMPNGTKLSSLRDEDLSDNDEDNTAKLSNDWRLGKGKESDYRSSSSTLERVKSLTERNRQVIDKLSSITSPDSHTRTSLATPPAPSSSSSRSRSPLPNTFSSSSSSTASSSSRVSLSQKPAVHGGSGSETEREHPYVERAHSSARGPRPQTPEIDDATPPATTRQQTAIYDHNGTRQRLSSAPTSPAKLPSALPPISPRKHASTSAFSIIGSGRRTRRVSIQQPDLEEEVSPGPHTASGSANKRSRAPLPREFRERRSLDGRSFDGGSTSPQIMQDRERMTSPGVFVARGAASPHSSGVGGTFATPTSPRHQRPARPSTVRESSRRAQRWSSVDEITTSGSGNAVGGGDAEGRRQMRQSGSAESPLGGKEGRSVVGEGLRAAGLARRATEDVFADGPPQRRTRLSGGLGTRVSLNGSKDGDLDELRRGIARIGIGLPDGERDPRDPRTPLSAISSASGSRYGTARNIHSVLTETSPRAVTSLGSYAEEENTRTSSAFLRNYRTSYGLPDRTSLRHTPQNDRSVPSPYGRNTPHMQSPSTEHARLMMDSLAIFESQLSRIPSSSSSPDLPRVAQSVVQSANNLNMLLRSGNTRALEAQIEAEVGDAAPQVDSVEVWRQVGGEYRESLRMSDELVRTVTALLLGVGRLVREAVRERSTDSPDVGGGGGSGRSSLDGNELAAKKPLRRSTDADGRRSAEGPSYRQSRQSWEDTEGSMRRSRVDLNSRPSTSLSVTRDRDRGQTIDLDDGGEETARERERSSTLNRLSIRRIFTPRSRDPVQASPASQDSPDLSYPSPSPASRNSLEHDSRTHTKSGVPPPLGSLPSESLLDNKGSNKSRRSKFSNTSNATVRGTSIFPTLNSPNPTTALSTQTVSAAGEVTAFPSLRTDISSSSALSGLQQQQERDVRKRAISAASLEGNSGSSGSSGGRMLRSSRTRTSLDEGTRESVPSEHSQHTSSSGSRRARRRTLNEALS